MEQTIEPSKVYIKTDENGCIIAIDGGYTTPANLDRWTQIDEGYGDKYNLCQSNYLPKSLYAEGGVPQYKLVDGKVVERNAEELEADRLPVAKGAKIADLSAFCNAAIVAGMDVETSQGTEHFSLEETDQINLSAALTAVQAGASDYPYHADGQLCRMFTAAEIQAIAQASVQHKLYHTTLCNHLLTWARRAETAEELAGISYTADNLPEDLAANMAEVLASASSL